MNGPRNMTRIEIPGTDAYLLLQPRLGGLPYWAQLALPAAAGLVILALIWRLYRTELRTTERGIARVLLALRLLIVAVVVVFITLRPVVGHTLTETIPSHVLVALDRSASMEVADSQRPVLEKLDLALGLRLAADLATPGQLQEWRKAVQAGGSVAEGERAAFDEVLKRVDSFRRRQVMERVLIPDGAGVLSSLNQRHAVRVVGFHQQIVELPADAAKLQAALAEAPSGSGSDVTDLTQPLAAALEPGAVAAGKPLGVILLTDGRHNGPGSPVTRAIELGRQSVPIYPVVIGSPTPPTDVAVASVQGTSTVFQHTDALVEARVLINNLRPGPVQVTLSWPDVAGAPKREPLTETIQHDGTTQLHTVRFQARMDRAGLETVTVTARPDAKLGQDRFPENDSTAFTIRVAPDKAKVLLIDGDARWEYHYIATALARDPTMDVHSVLFDQPRLGTLTDDALKEMKYPERKLPTDPEALFAYDCIVLGDASPDDLSLPDRERLERYVAERGGTLVLAAGKRSLPLEYLRRFPDPARLDPLLKLLPIESPQPLGPEKGFGLTLTGEGRQTPFLRLEQDPAESSSRWAKLPPHYWGVVGKAKGGAVALAYAGGEKGDGDSERSQVLLARHHYGFGRVLYVGIDSTWRWRLKTGDQYHHRFWGQVIRWAASDRPLVAGNQFVRFGPREPVYRTGQPVDVLMRVGEQARPLPPDALAGVRVIRVQSGGKEESVGLIPLKPTPGQTRELTGQLGELPPGEYALEPAIPEMEDKLAGPDGKKLRATFSVSPPESGERIDLSTNIPLLEELAAKNGGKVFPAERAAELIDLLASRAATRQVTHETDLSHSGWVLVALVALLTLEWLLRKRAGLV
jgi:hypothetical protein